MGTTDSTLASMANTSTLRIKAYIVNIRVKKDGIAQSFLFKNLVWSFHPKIWSTFSILHCKLQCNVNYKIIQFLNPGIQNGFALSFLTLPSSWGSTQWLSWARMGGLTKLQVCMWSIESGTDSCFNRTSLFLKVLK